MKMRSALVLIAMVLSTNLWAKELAIMGYNMENLFDTTHDEGKEDWTYLPLDFKRKSAEVQKYCRSLTNDHYRKECFETDWSEKVLEKKLSNLASVIKEYNKGRGADILMVSEVENENVLNILVDTQLSDLGYNKPVLIEGPDNRGIDVGIISRLPLVSKKYHQVKVNNSGFKTRGILEATFKLENGKLITVFANHWPSQSNPSSHRLAAAKTLRAAIDELPESNIAVALGDFNTLDQDRPHGINEQIVNKNLARPMVDLTLHKEASSRGFVGSHWYRGGWSMLDRIFILKSSLQQVEVLWDSFEVLKRPFMVKNFTYRDYQTGRQTPAIDVPKRFDMRSGDGFSDHLPVAVTLDVK